MGVSINAMDAILQELNFKLNHDNTYQTAFAFPIVNNANKLQMLAVTLLDVPEQKKSNRITPILQLAPGNYHMFLWKKREENKQNGLHRVFTDEIMEIPVNEIHTGDITFETIEQAVKNNKGTDQSLFRPFVRVPLQSYEKESKFALIQNPVEIYTEIKEVRREGKYINITYTTISIGPPNNKLTFTFPSTNESSKNPNQWETIQKNSYEKDTKSNNYYKKEIDSGCSSITTYFINKKSIPKKSKKK